LPQSLCAEIFAVLRRHAAIIYTNMSPVLALPSFSRKGCEARRPVLFAVVMHAARSSPSGALAWLRATPGARGH
jgi:hypothetical protein